MMSLNLSPPQPHLQHLSLSTVPPESMFHSLTHSHHTTSHHTKSHHINAPHTDTHTHTQTQTHHLPPSAHLQSAPPPWTTRIINFSLGTHTFPPYEYSTHISSFHITYYIAPPLIKIESKIKNQNQNQNQTQK